MANIQRRGRKENRKREKEGGEGGKEDGQGALLRPVLYCKQSFPFK